MKFLGIDFGTSDSLASIVKNNAVQFGRFADGNTSNPTLLFFPAKSKSHYIGAEAAEQYIEHLEDAKVGGRLMLSIKTLLPEANFDQTLVPGHGNLTAAGLAGKF